MAIEPELLARRRLCIPVCRIGVPVVVCADDIDDCRRSILFVWTFSIGVGVGVWVRSAAAAAAEDRLPLDAREARYAAVAAVCADGDGVVLNGYRRVDIDVSKVWTTRRMIEQ